MPALRSLDLRLLDLERAKKRPSFVELWADAAVTKRLARLGLPGGEIKAAQMKKSLAAFSQLEVVVIHDLLTAMGEPISAVEKNPIGGNVLVESELGSTALGEVAAAIAAMPRLEQLTPQLSDEALASLSAALEASRVRYPKPPLLKMLAAFCKQRQFARVERLLDLAKKKAPDRWAYIEVRMGVEVELKKTLDKKPDPAGQRLHDRLVEENRV